MSNDTVNETKSTQTPFVSVIMPVYRAEKFLEESVLSVLNQSFGAFELLLVNDCSPDRSGEICDELASRDSRIKVIHLSQNSGASKARNAAMEVACGEYILFLDSEII